MAKDSRRPETMASPKRREIIRRSAELFDRNGAHATSMIDVAEAIGLSKSTLYHYFTSKDEIVAEIHDDLVDTLLAKHDARGSAAESASDGLRAMLTDYFELLAERGSYFRVFWESHQSLPEHLRDRIAAKRRRYRSEFEDVIRAGVASGEFKDLDPKLTTLGILGMCNWAHEWFQPRPESDAGAVAHRLATLVLGGLAA